MSSHFTSHRSSRRLARLATVDGWRRIGPHLDRALDLMPAAREAWLAELRCRDAAMASDVDRLLDVHRRLDSEHFLEDDPRPTAAVGAGAVLGAYKLVEPIGYGGMSTVWLASRSDGRFEGLAAIKLLYPEPLDDGPGNSRREATILARLTHGHIARLMDAGTTSGGQPYLVLEFVDGRHIDAYCDEQRLSVHGRLRLFLDVLAAVGHAHANLIVHGDLKPSNVLVTRSGDVKLLDFGVASLAAGARASSPSVRLGRGVTGFTPMFAAPEQLRGDPIGPATDVYALGVLLRMLIGGCADAGSSRATAGRPTLRPWLRRDLDAIVGKALNRVPGARYSADAFADDLRSVLSHQPIGARPHTFGDRAVTFVMRLTAAILAR